MSSSQFALQASPVQIAETQKNNQQIERLEQLLGKIFNDEIEKALSTESTEDKALIDFSPFFESQQPEEKEEVELKSIISADDVQGEDYDRLTYVIDAQRDEIVSLRRSLEAANQEVRLQNLTLASKEDQLKYLPELFIKALTVSELTEENQALKRDLSWEREAHAHTAEELTRILKSVENKSLWTRIWESLFRTN